MILLNSIINIIFILFPNLIYLIYVANKQNLTEEENLILMDVSILMSLFLIIIYQKYFYVNNIIIYCLILLIFCFLNKRLFCAILVSIISFEYIKSFDIFNNLTIILLFSGNIIIYLLFYRFKNLNIHPFCLFSLIIVFFSLYFKNYENFIIILSNFLLFYLIVILLKMWLTKVKKILELQNTLKSYKAESELKISLFKITHEIKNPLAVVKGYLSMIDLKNKEKAEKHLTIINSEVERTINLLEDFMQFNKIKIDANIFEFNHLLEEVKVLLSSLFESKNINVSFKSENNILIKADYNRIKQVIINIIKNSIEASEKYGKINITCYVNENNLIVIIKDFGSGMSKETLESISTPFFTTKEKGTGLGVCLSKEIIVAHKGKLSYTSVQGKGTTSKIVIPINNF